jgi:hypothetical protein
MATDFRLTIDRFEGDLAVVVTDDDQTLNVPRAGLPTGARAGDVLTVAFQIDRAATESLRAEARAVQDELKKTDPGGDVSL